MARGFLATHGIDLDAELSRMQCSSPSSLSSDTSKMISNISLPSREGTFDVTLSGTKISGIIPHAACTASSPKYCNGNGALLAPSLCHPHIHLDKAYLLSHPSSSHLQIKDGTFAEAMRMTNVAKECFTREDLLERGQRLIDESLAAGVTHMRAFVEVDGIVGLKCLEAGIALKQKAEGTMHVQLCAFAQLPLFSDAKTEAWSQSGTAYDPDGSEIRRLMRKAAAMGEVEVLGSTPYVETGRGEMEKNVLWMVDLSVEFEKHLDFHLDYNLDPAAQPMVWHVLSTLRSCSWKSKTKNRTVVLGHCTRLTLFEESEWEKLRTEMADLPLSFVGLPTSDLYMIRSSKRARGTLDVPTIINDHGLNACIGLNNIGNAFTPYGSCDPLLLAHQGVGVYSAGSDRDAELLYECVSTRARSAIGFMREDGRGGRPKVEVGDEADLVLFRSEAQEWRTRREVSEAVYLYDGGVGRRAWCGGQDVQ